MPAIRFLLCTAAVCSTATAAAAGPASPGRVAFHIPPGPLDAALTAFAQQSGQQLLFDSRLVAGRRSPGLGGSFRPEDALARLLKGVPVSVVRTGPGVLVLRAPGAARTPERIAQGGSLGADIGPSTSGALVAAAVTGAAAATVTAPLPKVEPSAPTAVETVVVTGSLIRGRSQASGELLTLSRDAMDRAGQGTVAEALAALPQAFGGVSSAQTELLGTDGLGTNLAASTGINLRGLGANSTLVLVNARRLAGSGLKADFGDVSSIPTAAVDHVEVLLDGASALYGSDAVGGVVNIILRKDFSGAETRVRYGAARGGDNGDVIVDQTFGKTWSDGRLIVSYEYEHADPLRSGDRESTASPDLRALGGTDHRSPYSLPGNLLAFDPATGGYGPVFAIRPGAGGTAVGPDDFVAGRANLENTFSASDVLPALDRHSIYVNAFQRLGPRADLELEARYTHRDVDFALPESVGIFAVTPANPFYVAPDGAPSETIGYAFGAELGPIRNQAYSQTVALSADFGVALGRSWRLDLSGDLVQEESRLTSTGLVNSGYLDEALGNTPDDPTTAYQAARDGYFNPYGDGRANSATVLGFIGSGSSSTRAVSREQSLTLKADGDLFSLPGGEAKLAVGGEVRQQSLHTSTLAYVYGGDPFSDNGPLYRRTITAGFAELRLPLVSGANALPMVDRLELSMAGRVEHYSDAGTTANPKIGLAWTPVEPLKLRATFGTSFRAPALSEIDAAQVVTPALVAQGAAQVLSLVQFGGDRNLKPETATTWTVGGEWRPPFLSHLLVTATWFSVAYDDRIGEPVYENFANALNDPSFAPFVTRVDPTRNPADLAQVQALIAGSPSASAQPFPATAYGAIIDARYVNSARLQVDGLDATASYELTRGPDRYDLAFNASYIGRFRRKLTSTSPEVELVGQVGQPPDLRLRAEATWSRGPFGATLGVNYTDGSQTLDGAAVDPFTTADLQLLWRSTATTGPARGLTLALNAQNLLDADPPFYDSPRGIGYDTANANPLGRVLSLQLTRRW